MLLYRFGSSEKCTTFGGSEISLVDVFEESEQRSFEFTKLLLCGNLKS